MCSQSQLENRKSMFGEEEVIHLREMGIKLPKVLKRKHLKYLYQ